MKKVKITVSGKFEDSLFEKLTKGISEKLGECEFEKITDDGIIDGFKVEADGTVYDYSVLSKLEQIEKILSD